jgi:hypothetical protein
MVYGWNRNVVWLKKELFVAHKTRDGGHTFTAENDEIMGDRQRRKTLWSEKCGLC